MPTFFGWAAIAALCFYLLAFAVGSWRLMTMGQQVWLFRRARGWDRVAAMAFRLGFALALLGPLLWLAVPGLHKADPLWRETVYPDLDIPGFALAALGTALALIAQSRMGASWRVGVPQAGDNSATGDLVTTGLFRLSRNPTFLGQSLLLLGVALAIPSLPGWFGFFLFLIAANLQIRSEERALMRRHGPHYAAYLQSVPRWIGLRRPD
ncbi:methyltransferase family protein [Pseudogemmobacter bohemicus]|uniref:methyltransferase family protein n=1 Tax=Pseudogemmobacter bohemicus TaxID=2250708 RepID=UPI000DD3362A|nr:isoprenylcysteine carboxylmethyltransferase family protein [Pseudogemmobacter bohemicus]